MAKIKLTYDDEYYTPQGARNLTDKQLRAEYSRLRSIARKRLERMTGTEFTDTQIYQLNVGKFRPVADLSNTEMRHLLSDVARFVTAKGSSVSGLRAIRRESIKTLHEHGYGFVNASNFRQFGRFMEYLSHTAYGRAYGSPSAEDANEMFGQIYKPGMTDKEFDKAVVQWESEQGADLRYENKKPKSAEFYRKRYK